MHVCACPFHFLQEISKAIGGSWTEANEEDLLAELAEIEKEAAPEPVPAPVPQPAAKVEEQPTPLEDMLPEAPESAPVVPVPAESAAAPQQAAEDRVPVAA